MEINGKRITIGQEHYDFGGSQVLDVFANHQWLGVVLLDDLITLSASELRKKIENLLIVADNVGEIV